MIKERDEKIIKLYLNNPEITIKDIAKQFQVSQATVTRIARIYNLPRRTGGKLDSISEENKKDIVNKYLNSVSMLKLQKKYNISYMRLKNIISQKTDIIVSSAKRKNPKLLENYFSNIDSPEKAYWLGWIISDGSITNNKEKNKYALELTIHKKDEEILHVLEKDLQVTNKVYTSAQNYKRFNLGCKQIVQDLEALGITKNKSFTVKIPEIPNQYQSHLIRGIFDGDGGFTVYTRKNGAVNCELSFCGNQFVIEKLSEILYNNLPTLKKKKIEKESSISRIRWGSKKDIKLIANFMYKNCKDHKLSRKQNLIYANIEVT